MYQQTTLRRGASESAFVGTLAWAMAAPVLSIHAVALLAPQIIDDLDLSKAQIGLIPSVFFATAALTSPRVGEVSDRISARAMLVVLWVGVMAGDLILGAAPVFPLMIVGILVVGIAAAISNPATNRLVATHAPPGRLGLLTGIKQSGVPLAPTVVGVALPPLAAAFGWQVAVAALSVGGFVGLLATTLTVPLSEPSSRRGAARQPVRWALLSPQTRDMAVYAALMGAGMATITVYLPVYGQEEIGLSAGQAGAVVSMTGIVGIMARLLWGRVADRTARIGRSLIAIAAGSVVASILLMLAARAGPALVWAGAMTYGATALSWNAVGMTALMRMSDRAAVGRDTGAVMFGFYGGYVLAPVLVGLSIDITGSYLPAWIAAAVVFLLACVPYLNRRRVSTSGAEAERQLIGPLSEER